MRAYITDYPIIAPDKLRNDQFKALYQGYIYNKLSTSLLSLKFSKLVTLYTEYSILKVSSSLHWLLFI